MTTLPKILVTSGAGQTGLQVALQLRQKGYPVRAFAWRKDHRTDLLTQAGVEVFVGNAYSVSDLIEAMDGCQRAYCCPPTASNGLHFVNCFAVAAEARGIEHVVYLGQWLGHATHPSYMSRETFLGERVISMLPDATQTIVAPGWFAANYFMGIEMVAGLGVLMAPLGPGDELKDVAPSNEDIASVAVGALITPEDHAGKFYRPTGPELISPNRVAAAMARAMGRKVRYVDAPERTFLAALRVLRPANFSEVMLTQLKIYANEYRRGAFAVGGPTDAVERVTGRRPETIEQIAQRIVASRPEARPSVGRTLNTIGKFMRIGITRAPNLAEIERGAGHVILRDAEFAQDSESWLTRIAEARSPIEAVAA